MTLLLLFPDKLISIPPEKIPSSVKDLRNLVDTYVKNEYKYVIVDGDKEWCDTYISEPISQYKSINIIKINNTTVSNQIKKSYENTIVNLEVLINTPLEKIIHYLNESKDIQKMTYAEIVKFLHNFNPKTEELKLVKILQKILGMIDFVNHDINDKIQNKINTESIINLGIESITSVEGLYPQQSPVHMILLKIMNYITQTITD